jgi:hypothetical protein
MIDQRSQALALDYVLGLGIAMILTVGLLVAGGGFMSEQRDAAAQTQLEVVGQQVAAQIEAADRLVAAAGSAGTVRLERAVPETIAGSEYRISLVETADPYLELRTTPRNTTARIEFTNVTSMTDGSVGGGPVAVSYTNGSLTLESGGN